MLVRILNNRTSPCLGPVGPAGREGIFNILIGFWLTMLETVYRGDVNYNPCRHLSPQDPGVSWCCPAVLALWPRALCEWCALLFVVCLDNRTRPSAGLFVSWVPVEKQNHWRLPVGNPLTSLPILNFLFRVLEDCDLRVPYLRTFKNYL